MDQVGICSRTNPPPPIMVHQTLTRAVLPAGMETVPHQHCRRDKETSEDFAYCITKKVHCANVCVETVNIYFEICGVAFFFSPTL